MAEQAKQRLYHTVNRMMAVIGSNGEVSSRHETVCDVMEALREIDGGRYEPESVPAFLDRIAHELVERDPGLHSAKIAASLQGRAVILRHVNKEPRHE